MIRTHLIDALEAAHEARGAVLMGTLFDVGEARERFRETHGGAAADDARHFGAWAHVRSDAETRVATAMRDLRRGRGADGFERAREGLLVIAASVVAQLQALDRAAVLSAPPTFVERFTEARDAGLSDTMAVIGA